MRDLRDLKYNKAKNAYIAKMDSTHLQEILKIEQSCFNDPWTYAMFESGLNNSNNLYFVYIYDDIEIGYICASVAADEMDIQNIAVSLEYQRNGIAKKLLDYIINAASERLCSSIFLEVRASNFKAINLYEKNKFTAIAKRKNYYDNPKEDAIVMLRKIGSK